MDEKKTRQTHRNSPRTFKLTEKHIPEKNSPRPNEEEKSIFDVNARDFRKILEFNGTTQTQFAKEMGISQQKVSDYLQGMDIPVSWVSCLIRICGEEQYKFILSQIRKGKSYRRRLH